MTQPRRRLSLVAIDAEQLRLKDEADVFSVVATHAKARLANAEGEIAVFTIGAAARGDRGHPQGILPVWVYPLEVVDGVGHRESVDLH